MKTIRYNHKVKCPFVDAQWGGGLTDGQFQFWQAQQFMDAAETGVELVYEGPEIIIEQNNIKEPFILESDMFYSIETDIDIQLSDKCSLLIIPHYRFYTDKDNKTPLPVMSSWQYDWYPKSLKIFFKMPSLNQKVHFCNGEPFAQAVVIQREEYQVVKFSDVDKLKLNDAKKFLEENKSKYITREWQPEKGPNQNNLYNVLVNMEKKDELPKELKKNTKKLLLLKK